MGCITSTPAVAPIEVVVRVHEREFSCTYCSPDGRSAWGSVFGRCCTDHQSARFCLCTIVVPPPPPHTQSGVFETWGAGAPSLRSVEFDLRLARRSRNAVRVGSRGLLDTLLMLSRRVMDCMCAYNNRIIQRRIQRRECGGEYEEILHGRLQHELFERHSLQEQ